jgi:DnaJ-class molecular chaperone
MAEQSYYDILGVAKDANVTTIKKARDKLAMKYHPDRLSGSNKEFGEAKFKEINEAYEVLSNPKKREIYDRLGKKGLEGGMGSDPMADLFNKQQSRHDIVPPIKIPIEISLKDLYLGTSVTKEFERKNICKECNRTGCKDKVRHPCKTCNGVGRSIQHIRRGPLVQQIQVPCSTCNGNGVELGTALCDTCHGLIFISEKYTITQEISPGSYNGKRIEIPNIGLEIPPELINSEQKESKDIKRGSVILIIQELEHPVFKRTDTGDADLAIELKISLAESLCGFKRSIEHLDGRKLAIIETETVHDGELKVIKHEGMPLESNTSLHGNLIVKFVVEFPTSLSKQNKRILYSCLTNGESFDDVDFSLPENHIMTHMVPMEEANFEDTEPSVQHVGCPVQ